MKSEEFVIRLGLNSDGVQHGINGAVGQISRLYNHVSKIGGVLGAAGGGLVAIGKFVKDQAAWAGELNDTADMLDTTARKVQALKYAAAATKTPFETFETGIDHIRKAQSEALQGSEEMRLNWNRLGYTVDDLKRKDAVDLFLGISKAVEEGKVSAANYAALLAIAGKESKKLIAAMKDGAASMAEGFDKSSFAVQRNLVDALDDADKGLSKLWTGFKALARLGGANFAGGFLSLGKLVGGAMLNATPGGDKTGANDLRDKALLSRELQNDDAYGQTLDIQTKLEAQLNAKLQLKEEEHRQYEILKKKNDEREKELKLAAMSSAERQRALETEREELRTQMDKTKNELEREKLRTRLVEVNGMLEKNKPEGLGGLAKADSDSLARIGGYRGGTNIANVPSQQLAVQREIATHARAIAQKLAGPPSPEVNKVISGLQDLVRSITPLVSYDLE